MKHRDYVILALCFVFYIGFHSVRTILPSGWFKDSFPSFLVPFVVFSITNLTVPEIRRWMFWHKHLIQIVALTMLAIWFEGVVPLFLPWSVEQWSDIVAIYCGYGIYTLKNGAKI
ncbi:MAG: hypothetical protein LBU65_07500 [Planctomycetaceae bacterium]|nr:hypothetical protein [Planctomycetaceae bacterium]